MGKINRKAQFTTYIVLGIILLFATAVIVSLWSTHLDKYLGNIGNDDQKSIKSSVDSCLKTMANDWLYVHGLYTGNYYAENADFGLNDQHIVMPDASQTEAALSLFLKENFAVCITNKFGYNITVLNPTFQVKLVDTKVLVQYDKLYHAVKEDYSFTSGAGGFEIGKRTKFVIEKTTDLIKQRRNEKYMKGAKEFLNQRIYLEVSNPEGNKEKWLITDKRSAPEYQFAFVVWVDK